MKILLVFDDWQKDNKSVYDDLDNGLTLGPFHHGTTFKAEINLDPEDAKELATAMENGATPVWYTLPRDAVPEDAWQTDKKGSKCKLVFCALIVMACGWVMFTLLGIL